MKLIPSLILLGAVVGLSGPPACVGASLEEGVAVAIAFDASGSMLEAVKDADGKSSPKNIIAARALRAIVQRLEAFVANAPAGAARKLDAGLYVFSGKDARELVALGPFEVGHLKRWTNNLPAPAAGTPLGIGVETASRALLKSPLARKHLLVITDGVNTVGPDPARVLPRLLQEAARKETPLSVHFVAFDVDAKLFDPIKKLGATVVGAANETQLNTQLEFILEKKILLEDEEPPLRRKTD
ncbi:MAG: hypothetical protein HYY24_26860 [Verrucomicrobia bacterium]|nr:hypothetical protein [Verrucomicrobiota bacterium]